MKLSDKTKITQAFRWRNGASLFRRSIVIGFLFAFQLGACTSVSVWAAQKLPVFSVTGPNLSVVDRQVLKTMDEAGYKSRLIQEEDFLFHLKPAETPYVLVPLSSRVELSAFGLLSRYVGAGGQVILISSGEVPEPSAQRLLELIGLNVTGTALISNEINLYWQGASLPGGDALTPGSRVLTLQPGLNERVLANWGQQYPAIITTAKGAFLNWPWGQRLSNQTLILALTRVMPMAKPDSIVFSGGGATQPPVGFEKAAREKTAREKTDQTAVNGADPEKLPKSALSPDYAFNLALEANKAAMVKAPSTPSSPVAIAEAETPVAENVVEKASSVKPAPPEPSTSAAPKAPTAQPANPISFDKAPASKTPVSKAPAVKPALAVPVKKSSKVSKEQAEAETEAEVLNNILGGAEPDTPGNPPSGPSALLTTPSSNVAQPVDPAAPQQPQKPFSFLDPEAAEVLAPAFDYGTYSYNLRILDDYNRRINNALETARQLSLEVPEEKIRAMLKEAYQHKRKFESLYLNNQTEAGLNQYAEARRITLRALALTSASPRVEGRAIWLDRGTILQTKNPLELKKLMLKLHQAGINIVYFETLNAGFPIYPSAILKRNPMVQGWDPLKAAVEEGHQLGMEVHAWVWVFAVGNQRHNVLIAQPDSYPGPVLAEGGLMSEALRSREGSLKAGSRQHEYWLNPASDKGRALLLKVYEEIVSQYDVDGLQLDYIRYPFQTSATRMGFDPVGRDRFYQATGQSLDNLDDYTAKLWIAWKTYQVSSFVQQVSERLRKIKPQLMISAAVFPMRRESRIVSIQQDWETWIDNGWVDTLSPMSYTSDPQRLQGMFDYVQSSPKKRSLIYPGIALHRLDGGQLVEQLEALRQHGGLGATLFAGAHLDQEKIDTLGAGPYKEQTAIPPHQNVVKSLQLILDDYGQKFNTLQAKGALSTLSAPQIQEIQTSIMQFHTRLSALSGFKATGQIPAGSLGAAQEALMALRLATDHWLQSEQNNRFRAEYFNHKIQLLDELLNYIAARNSVTIKAAKFVAPALPVKGAAPSPSSVRVLGKAAKTQ
ncbi:family 10 glycosylhydrolase [Vampirovibrio sp.]|uniref:glycoside hydrolase family 10 protein n=1 Tax=Vampirovibrio sp. TaxID=2717857 RepID=UPI0035937144